MKRTTLAVAILCFLAGPAPVLAEVPVVKVKPLEVEVVPAGVEAAAAEAAPQPAAETAAAAKQAAAAAQAVTSPAVEAAPAGGESPAGPALAAGTEPAPAPAPTAAQPEAAAAAGDSGAQAEMPEETAEAGPAPAARMAGMPCPKHGKGKMGMVKGPYGKGMGGMKPGCDHSHKGYGGKRMMMMQGRHEDVVRRLDMIEARMAKIEAMLESLMRRAQDQ